MKEYLKIFYGIFSALIILVVGIRFSMLVNHGFSVAFSIVLILFIAFYLFRMSEKKLAIGMFIGLFLVVLFFAVVLSGLSKMH